MNKTILLSFDTEEFDLPLEYNQKISKEEQFEFSLKGLEKVLILLEKLNIRATFFVTASFTLKYPNLIKKISEKHEISSHGLHHKVQKYNEKEVRQSKAVIEDKIRKKIVGFRQPRLQKVDFKSLSKLGFQYDSSVCPAYIPGRYNNYFKKKGITFKNNIYEVPVSTLPLLHIPISWVFFRFFGLKYIKLASILCLKNPGFINIYFHPWEFNHLQSFKIPNYIKKNSGEKLIVLLEKYILWCRKNKFKFKTFSELLHIKK
jgi:peptidoglycan/xylan/chitin deacetylase (PgdA/CDA1 family)